MTQYVVAVDQGTASTRCMVIDPTGTVVCSDQVEHRQLLPRAGWVEYDPQEIWANTQKVTAAALEKADLVPARIAACGITNQRETAVVWERAAERESQAQADDRSADAARLLAPDTRRVATGRALE